MKKPLALLLPVALYASSALAASLPDAGSLLRDQPKPPSPAPAPSKPLVVPEADPSKNDAPRVLVKGFRFVGSTLVAESELQAQLAEAVGKEYSFQQLQGMALQLIGYYAQKGYLARVFIAPQDFKDGTVTFTVVEGKLGELKLDTSIDTSRIDAARVQRFLAARLQPGEKLSLASVGEAMNVLNEQPGIRARASLKPGRGEGDVDLLISATATPATSYGFQLNNSGTRATGELQLSGNLALNNPSGHFDRAALLFNAADGIAFVNGDYSIAVGDRGLRLGATASKLRYRVTQASPSALQGKGDADTFGVYASYPLERLTQSQLTLTASLNRRHMKDNAAEIETSNRTVTVGSIGVSGWRFNPALAGVTNYGLDLSAGETDRSGNAGDLNQDQLGRRSDGGFTKLAWRVGHLAPLADSWNLYANVSGQFANRSLESSERFTLGGPNGVRAYPVSEGNGDEGWLLNLNLLHPLSDTLAVKFFIDHGQIRLNRTLWAGWNDGNPNQSNRYVLSGIGGGIDWKIDKNLSLGVTLAMPLGKNPGRDSNGHDADGRHTGARLWASLSANF